MPRFRLIVKPNALIAFLLLWLTAALVFKHVITDQEMNAVVAGLGVAVLHWVGLLAHHYGHALAARSTGYSSNGLRLWWWMGMSLYPEGEPDLAPSIHIRRALGGPIAGALLGLAAGWLAVGLKAADCDGWYLAAFLAADSLLIYTFGALLPLGFTDGSTLLRWRSSRKE
jgi:hypothetical protein